MTERTQYLSAVIDKRRNRIRFTFLLDTLLLKSMVGKGGLEALLDDLTSYTQTLGRSYAYNDGVLQVSDDLDTYPKPPNGEEARVEGILIARDISRRIETRLAL
ncbi:MAG TPA: hypothetical protein VFZ48_02950 [Candidatus Saccharimonadales bacterium]